MRIQTASRSLVFVVLAALASAILALPASASPDAEAEFVALVNQARAQAGAPALTVRGDLRDVARSHSARMADQQHLHHNPNLGSDVQGWQKVGENVGVGPSVATIHRAFMDSPGHRANVLDSSFAEIGVGVVVRDGRIWVTEVFRLPQAAEPAPAPEPAPASAPDPAPATQPEPTPAANEPPTQLPSHTEEVGDFLRMAEEVEETGPTGSAPAPGQATPALDRGTIVFSRIHAQEAGLSASAVLERVLQDG